MLLRPFMHVKTFQDMDITGLSVLKPFVIMILHKPVAKLVWELCLRGYGEFWQDRLEVLAAGFLTPLHHLVQERSVGLGHDDSTHRRERTTVSKTESLGTIIQSESIEVTQFSKVLRPKKLMWQIRLLFRLEITTTNVSSTCVFLLRQVMFC